jgi:hypothetical protein
MLGLASQRRCKKLIPSYKEFQPNSLYEEVEPRRLNRIQYHADNDPDNAQEPSPLANKAERAFIRFSISSFISLVK